MNELNAVTDQPASACCGGPAPKTADACCVKDVDAKAAGETGCGCGAPSGGTAAPPELLRAP
jgi:hypothetical protein